MFDIIQWVFRIKIMHWLALRTHLVRLLCCRGNPVGTKVGQRDLSATYIRCEGADCWGSACNGAATTCSLRNTWHESPQPVTGCKRNRETHVLPWDSLWKCTRFCCRTRIDHSDMWEWSVWRTASQLWWIGMRPLIDGTTETQSSSAQYCTISHTIMPCLSSKMCGPAQSISSGSCTDVLNEQMPASPQLLDPNPSLSQRKWKCSMSNVVLRITWILLKHSKSLPSFRYLHSMLLFSFWMAFVDKVLDINVFLSSMIDLLVTSNWHIVDESGIQDLFSGSEITWTLVISSCFIIVIKLHQHSWWERSGQKSIDEKTHAWEFSLQWKSRCIC